MTKDRVQWTAPNKAGEPFIFEYELKKHYEASSVKIVRGVIYEICSSSTAAGNQDGDQQEEEASGATNKALVSNHKKRKSEQEVGYLEGYLIRRNNNANFHLHGDVVSQELHEFTVALYDSRGKVCRAPLGSPLTSKTCPPVTGGGMLLIEKIEIRNHLRGQMDLGIHFLHELLSSPNIIKETGLVVANPWTLSRRGLRYEDNIEKLQKSIDGKNESEEVDILRQDTVKLRRQFSRIGFQAVHTSPDFVDKWFLSMEKYKKMPKDKVESSWLTKEVALQLDIPMKAKRHIYSDRDIELKGVIQSMFSEYACEEMLMARNFGSFYHSRIVKLDDTVKARIKKLVEVGASLQSINALHMASANYKSSDLFDFLIGECNMNLEAFDEDGNMPVHVAAACNNIQALRILIARGANKKGETRDGLTALQVLAKEEQSMSDFRNVFGIGTGMGSGVAKREIKALLR